MVVKSKSRWIKSIGPVAVSLAVGLLLILSACVSDVMNTETPVAEKGILDLRDWNFKDDGLVKLDGDWQFYWNHFLHPEDFKQSDLPEQTGVMTLPRLWNDYDVSGEKLGGHGFATFRLKILMPPTQQPFALKVSDMATAYRIWADDKPILSNGTVGKNIQSSIPQFYPKVVRLDPSSDTILLTIHVSNFHHKKGGVWMPIFFGPENAIRQKRDRILAIELLLFGSLLIMAFYQAGLYFLRRNDRSSLFFSAVCSLTGLRILLVGERFLIQLFPGFSWEVYQKLEYIVFFLSISFFLLFMTSLFHEFSKPFSRLVMIVSILFSIFTIVTPARIFSHELAYFQIVLLVVSLYTLYKFSIIVFRRRDESAWIVLGVIILMITVLLDVLAVNDLFPTYNITPIGLFFFIFFQSFTLSMRFSKAFTIMETLSLELSHTNEQKDRFLEASKESEKKYRELIENMDAVFLIIDLEGRFKYVSPAVSRVFQYDPDQILNASSYDFFLPEEVKDVTGHFQKLQEGTSRIAVGRIYNKAGEIRWVRFNMRPYYESDQITGVQGFITDITERKQSEELMIQTEKMMSLGGLAAGMAHELNNPIGSMLQGVQIIQQRLSPDLKANERPAENCGVDLNKLESYIEERDITSFFEGIKEAGIKASEIIRSMLQFSRRSESRIVYGDLSKLLEKALDLAGKDYNLKKKYDFRNIKIEREFESNMPAIPFTETELEQVFLNLLSNAAWAMANHKREQTPRITLRIGIDKEMAKIEVEDNGPGINEETRKRVFEPFFTTKPIGEGTGLGLSVSYMIITNNHKGSMEVESESGKGARFIIRLPLTSQLA